MNPGRVPAIVGVLLLLAAGPDARGAEEPVLTVCPSGCTHANPLDAWNAAKAAVAATPGRQVTIRVADGEYRVADQFYTDQPDTQGIQVVGNAAAPGKVVFHFTNIVGNNGDGFTAERGGRIGTATRPGVDGVTLDGVGARRGRADWASQSYGAGALALGSGSNIYFGPHVVVQNFYYGVLADQGGRFVGDRSTFRNAGDANLLARFGGVIQCLSCTLATAAHVFTNAHGATETLGRNAMAEGSASLYADGSTASDGQVACFAAQTNATVWAHGVTGTACPAYGATAEQGGMIELNHARFTASGTGAYAGTGGRMNVDGLELDHATADGIVLDGGAATGTGLNAHDNGGFGVKVIKGGRGEFYGTGALLLRNRAGRFFVEHAAGCTATDTPCNPGGTLIVN